jgi:site-specific DNA-methyltransferase (adenine-specific)
LLKRGEGMNEQFLNKVLHGNCLEWLPRIEDDSISLICIDPPYNIGKAKWDKWKTVKEYISFLGLVLVECIRVMKNNASLYIWHSDFLQMVEIQNWINKNTELQFKRLIVWDKFNGTKWNQLNANVHQWYNRNYPQQAEYCLYYTFGDVEFLNPQSYLKEHMNELTVKYIAEYVGVSETAIKHWIGESNNPRMPTEKNYLKLKGLLNLEYDYQEFKKLQSENRYIFNNQNLPSVWQHEAEKPNGHITPKPVLLIENIIKTSSIAGDTILDCFGGSGTSAVASIRNNRNFILIEKEWDYCEIANDRIKQARHKLV